MSKYTTTLYEILKSGKFPNYPQNDYEIDDIIEAGIPVLFSFDYPWYTDKSDESYKEFQVMFCNMYLMREIGFETVALFKQKLKDYLIRWMPYYEQIYYTTTLEYNPLINKDYTINRDRGTDRNTNRNENSSSSSKKSGSEDSDANITNTGSVNRDINTDDETNSQGSTSENPEITVNDNNFTSNLQRDRSIGNSSTTDDTTTKDTSDTTATRNYNESDNRNTETIYLESEKTNENRIDTINGFEGENKTQAIIAYRNAILNINLELCEKMKPLFMHIY